MRQLAAAAVFCASAACAQPCLPRWHGHSINGVVGALYLDSTAAGPQLLVGGDFTSPAYIARFDGHGFVPAGLGLGGAVGGIVRHDDGSGSKIYVTGTVSVPFINSWTANFARLEGDTFHTFGPSNGPLTALGPPFSYNLGFGPKLITTGGFGDPCLYATEWNGTSWGCLGPGLDATISSACIYDDGTGPALVCVGSLLVHGDPDLSTQGIAKWNGQAWSSVGGGMDGGGTCCMVYNDGSGPELFVGGAFTRIGTAHVAASCIAKYNGHRWAPLADGFDRYVLSMAAFDDGSGMKLYIAGASGSVPVQRLVRWDGHSFSACPAGSDVGGMIYTLAAADIDGDGPLPTQLFAGGEFTSVAGIAASNFAVLTPGSHTADFNHDGVTDFFDYLDFVASFSAGTTGADFNQDGLTDFFDYLDFVAAFAGGC